jgi:hypothetical protein
MTQVDPALIEGDQNVVFLSEQSENTSLDKPNLLRKTSLNQESLPGYFIPPSIASGLRGDSQLQNKQKAHSIDGQSPRERRPANKRGRYVSNACITCQKRKVKCSGEETCLQCRTADLVCTYNSGRKRRNTTTTREEVQPVNVPKATPPKGGLENQKSTSEDILQSEALLKMMERIASLERECNIFKSHVSATGNDHDIHGSSSSYSTYSDTCSPGSSSVTSLPYNDIFHGATNLLEPIEILNRTVACEANEQQDMMIENHVETQVTWHDLPKIHNKDLKTLERETRMLDMVDLCHSVDVFFSYLNPHYPCLNENHFRAQFRNFVDNANGTYSHKSRCASLAFIRDSQNRKN